MKIKLETVKYKHHPKGSILSAPGDLSKEAANFMIRSKVASEIIEKKSKKGDK